MEVKEVVEEGCDTCIVVGIHGIDECYMGVDGWIDDKLLVQMIALYWCEMIDSADEEVHEHRQHELL